MIKDKAILPISYFGPIRYFSLLNNYDCSIEQHENYQKRTIRNRSVILSSNGPLSLSVPLQKGKTRSPIKKTRISYDEPWQSLHIKSLRSAYSSAPYFDYYFDQVSEVISSSYETLFELDMATVELIQQLGLLEGLAYTAAYVKTVEADVLDMRVSNDWSTRVEKPYIQVFESKYGFTPALSILDALFNLGPETATLINE